MSAFFFLFFFILFFFSLSLKTETTTTSHNNIYYPSVTKSHANFLTLFFFSCFFFCFFFLTSEILANRFSIYKMPLHDSDPELFIELYRHFVDTGDYTHRLYLPIFRRFNETRNQMRMSRTHAQITRLRNRMFRIIHVEFPAAVSRIAYEFDNPPPVNSFTPYVIGGSASVA